MLYDALKGHREVDFNTRTHGTWCKSNEYLCFSLQALESKTPMERLSRDFLQRRKQWLKELDMSDYASVAQLGKELFESFVTPPSTVQPHGGGL